MLPKVVILTAIQEEYEAVRAHLSSLSDDFFEGTAYEKGDFSVEHHHPIAEVFIRLCGQSNINAAVEAERAVHAFQPDYMFFVGIAGGRKDVAIGDVVFGSKIYYYEVQKITAEGAKYRPDQATPTYEIEEIAKMAQTKPEWQQWIKGRKKRFQVKVGAIASGEKLIDAYDSVVATDIDRHFNDTLAVEMEGFGFGRVLSKQGGKARHIYFGVFRGISDLLKAPAQPNSSEGKRPTGAKQVASRTASALAFWTLYNHIANKKKELIPPAATTPTKFLTDETASLAGTGREIIGRQPEANALKQALDMYDKVVVVNGIGGIGKTTLAKLFIDTYAREYSNVLWLNGVNGIPLAFRNFDLIKELDLFDQVASLSPDQLFDRVIDKLKAIQPRYSLLVLDNVDRKIEKRVSDKIQLKPNWKVLLTSRITFSGYKSYLLSALSNKDCLHLFFTHYTKETRDEVTEAIAGRIIKAVFNHTLTIELLAKTTQANRSYTLQKLYTVLEQEGLSDRLAISIDVSGYNRMAQRVKTTIHDCLQIAFSVAELGNDPLKRDLLAYLSVLPPMQIAYSVLMKLFLIDATNDTKFQNALSFLVERGWLDETIIDGNHFLYMHPVVQLTLRKRLKPTASKISGLINELANLIRTGTYERRSVEELMLYTPFVESVIENLPPDDESVAALCENYAGLSREVYGDHRKALDFAQRAYTLRTKRLPADHVDMATSANSLAIALRFNGEFQTALMMSQQAITILNNKPDKTDELLKELAVYHQNQGQILRNLNQNQEAIAQFRKSLSLLQQHQLDHPHLMAAANGNIGVVYNNQLLDARSALPYYQEAVRIAETSNDPKLYHYYNNLADCLIDNGRLLEALSYQLRVVEQYEKAPNKEQNSNLAIAYKVLSDIYGAIGGDENIVIALLYQNKAIFIKENINNPVSLAISYTAMAKLYKAESPQKDLQKALHYQLQANELFKQKSNAQIVTGLEVLTDLYMRMGKRSQTLETHQTMIEQARIYRTAEQTEALITDWQKKLL